MRTCALIGDRDMPESKREYIRQTLQILVKNLKVDFFYVSNDGNFDEIAEEELYDLCSNHPHLGYNVMTCTVPYKEYDPLEIYKRNLCPVFGCKESSKDNINYKIKHWMIKEAEIIVIFSRGCDKETEKIKKFADCENKIVINVRLKK